jgi:hypothetical protein
MPARDSPVVTLTWPWPCSPHVGAGMHACLLVHMQEQLHADADEQGLRARRVGMS